MMNEDQVTENKHEPATSHVENRWFFQWIVTFSGAVEFKNSIQSDLNVFLSSVLDFYIEHAEEWVNAILED
jgi:hypothetical protein